MNKADLKKVIATKTGLTQKDAGNAIDAVLEALNETLSKGDKVQLVGFGSFEVRKRAARNGVNPRTGKKIKIKAKKVVKFNPGKALREAV